MSAVFSLRRSWAALVRFIEDGTIEIDNETDWQSIL